MAKNAHLPWDDHQRNSLRHLFAFVADTETGITGFTNVPKGQVQAWMEMNAEDRNLDRELQRTVTAIARQLPVIHELIRARRFKFTWAPTGDYTLEFDYESGTYVFRRR